MRVVGIGTRIISFLVDTTIIFLIAYLLNRTNNFYMFYWKYSGFSSLTIFAITLVVYYLISEGVFGNSLGKKASLSKVVDKDGKRPNFFQIVIRSIVRLIPIDFVWIPFTDRTLHDIISKTYVIEK